MAAGDIDRFHQHLRLFLASLPRAVLLDQAATHGLDALLGYAQLRGLPVEPGSAGSLHLDAFKRRVAMDLSAGDPLSVLSRALAAHGVRALLLKGEAWSRSVYPLPGVRSRGDSDIWVARRDRDAALVVLKGLGYAEVRPYACAGEVLTPEVSYRGHGLYIDLHWQLSTLSPICRGLDFDACWQRSVTVDRLPVWRMLAPADALLHAAVHFACPGPAGPRWISALDGLLLRDRARDIPMAPYAAAAGIGDLWDSYDAFLRAASTGRHDAAVPAPGTGRELRLLLARAPWRDRLRLVGELLWPRDAFLRDRFADPHSPISWLQLRRWWAFLQRNARRD